MIEILRISIPLTVWISGFSALYALQGLTCSRHWPAALDAQTVLLIASAVAVVAQALCLLAIRCTLSSSCFVQNTATSLAVTALVAAIWSMLPVVATTACL